MAKNTLIAAIALGSLFIVNIALAQTDPAAAGTPAAGVLPVVFPIAELGGCSSKDACRVYCDIEDHHDACFAYAQTHGLMRQDEIQKAREFLKQRIASSTPVRPKPPVNASSSIDAALAADGGPGGCTTRDACKIYCSDSAHSDECLAFAKKFALMSDEEILKARKLESQVGPGGCRGEECKAYCADTSHTELCVQFAQQNGFISKDDAQKRLEMMRFSSTTKPFNIPVNGTGTVSTTTPGVRPNLDTARLKGLCTTAEECMKVCKSNPTLCAPGKPTQGNGSTTGQGKPGGYNTGTTTKPFPTSAGEKPFYLKTPGATNSGMPESTTDEGQNTPPPPPPPPPGAASSSNEQSGSIFLSILHFFGI